MGETVTWREPNAEGPGSELHVLSSPLLTSGRGQCVTVSVCLVNVDLLDTTKSTLIKWIHIFAQEKILQDNTNSSNANTGEQGRGKLTYVTVSSSDVPQSKDTGSLIKTQTKQILLVGQKVQEIIGSRKLHPLSFMSNITLCVYCTLRY